MELRVLTWNVFHGRDAPPEPSLHTLRSRLLRVSERGRTHLQVNRDLFAEFCTAIDGAEWDIALLQECPPRWADPLARACGAVHHRELTSRNWLAAITGRLARINPDLIGSWEGGSNTTLVRAAAGDIVERRRLVIRRHLPERRAMAFSRLRSGICVANLHASSDRPQLAEHELLTAAETALSWAGGAALIFGGDLNLRPRNAPVFERLARDFELRGVTDPTAIDHLLVRGLEVLDPPRSWPPGRRDHPADGLAIRLSDHSPVSARYLLAGARS